MACPRANLPLLFCSFSCLNAQCYTQNHSSLSRCHTCFHSQGPEILSLRFVFIVLNFSELHYKGAVCF